MAKQFRLWTLNDATAHFENGSSWGFDVPAPTKKVKLVAARRSPHENLPNESLGTPTRNTQLMHEGSRVDEYWVPIAAKCIGDLAHARKTWVDTGNIEKAKLFDGIAGYYQAQFDSLGDYWKPLAFDGQRRMGTRDLRGLYDLLQQTTPPGEQNILIGYSEGGLVARFLAMLDECVSKRPVIAGFITVHSPNAGSVFGSRKNADHTIAGMLSLVFCAANVDQDVCGVFHKKLFELAPPGVGAALLDWLGAAAEAGLADFQARYDEMLVRIGKTIPATEPGRETKIWAHRNLASLRADSAVLFTIHRWMSGLRNDRRYVFPDFDVRRLDDDYSVLGALYDHPLDRVHHAALCGWDFSVGNLLFPGLLESADNFLPDLDGIEADISAQAKVLMQEQGPLGPVSELFRALMSGDIAGSTAAQLKVYSGRSLRTGPPDWKPGIIPRFAHDYIVPAAYQLIHPHEASGMIGNFVFDDETHATGVDRCKTPIMNLLGVMAKRLA